MSTASEGATSEGLRWTGDVGMLIIVWVITPVAAVLPIALAATFQIWFGHQGVSWTTLTSRGELFLVAVGICAGAVGDVVLSFGTSSLKKVRVIVLLFTLMTLAAALLCYALVYVAVEISAGNGTTAVKVNGADVTLAGNVVLGASFLTAVFARVLAAIE